VELDVLPVELSSYDHLETVYRGRRIPVGTMSIRGKPQIWLGFTALMNYSAVEHANAGHSEILEPRRMFPNNMFSEHEHIAVNSSAFEVSENHSTRTSIQRL
jgi:hypothetical protein